MASTSTGYSAGAPALGGGSGASDDEEGGYSVTKLKQQYLDFQNAKTDEINEQRTARHYFHNDQLTAEELKVLKKRRQPPVIRNMIDRKINGVVGLVERLRQDPKAYPRTPQEDERGGADLATATVRYGLDKPNADDCDWPSLAAEAARNGAINGPFGVELSLVRGDNGDPDTDLAIVDPDTFFYDPRSVRYSFSDARFMGVAKWVDLDVAQEMFPDQAELLASLVSTGSTLQNTEQQQDRERHWVDTNRKRLFLIEHWHIGRGGEWFWCFYVGDTKIKAGPSQFYDEKGKTTSRYIMDSVNIDHDGDRYGFIRPLKSRQDEVNARGSKSLHILNMRRIIMELGAVDDIETVRQESVRPDGVIVRNPGKELEFDDQKMLADFQGQLELMAEVKTEIENFGPNPALIGEGIENKSGRAIALLQQAGIAELGPFILRYRSWKLRVYRAIWNAQQRYWTSERWIRVTDDEGVAQFIGLNQMQIDERGIPVIANQLGALDVDIILDEGPDTINLMQDTYDTLQAMAQAGAQIPPEVLIELSPVPAKTKRKLLEIMAQAKQPDPEAEQIQKRGAMSKIAVNETTARKNEAGARKLAAEAEAVPARGAKDMAGAIREVADTAIAINSPPVAAARPSDGGLGQF